MFAWVIYLISEELVLPNAKENVRNSSNGGLNMWVNVSSVGDPVGFGRDMDPTSKDRPDPDSHPS